MALSNLTKVQTVGIGSNIEVVGVITTGQFKTGTSNLHSSGVELTNLNVSGIATIGGSISIGGTLTYQDVTNVDSIGIVTARQGVRVNADGSSSSNFISVGVSSDLRLFHEGGHSKISNFTNNLKITSPSGSSVRITKPDESGNVAVFNIDAETHLYYNGQHKFSTVSDGILSAGNLTITDSIIHHLDTNTKIRFPAVDTITAETAGSERLRIDSDGRLLIGVNASGQADANLQVFRPTGTTSRLQVGNVATSASGVAGIDFCPSNKVMGSRIECQAQEDFSTSANRTAELVFFTRHNGTSSEKVRIESGGNTDVKRGLRVSGEDAGWGSGNEGAFMDYYASGNMVRLGHVNGASGSAKDVVIYSGGSEKLRIDSSGISGNIKNNYALVALVTDRDDGSRSSGATSYQDDTGLNLVNAINYRHGDIFIVRVLVPVGIALVSTDTTNYQGVFVRIKITPSSGTTRYSADTKGWYRDDGRATKETMQLVTCYYHLTASNTSQFNDNVNLSFQVQYHRDAGGAGSYGATGLSVWAGERTMEVWQFRKQL